MAGRRVDETFGEFLTLCRQLAQDGVSDAVLATLVEAQGMGRAAGRRAWVLLEGQLRGTLTLGGCADHQLRQLAAEVRAARQPRLVTVHLGSGEAYEFGLTCSGQVTLHLAPASPADPLWAWAARVRGSGQGLTLVTPLGQSLPGQLPLEGHKTLGVCLKAGTEPELSPGASLNPQQWAVGGELPQDTAQGRVERGEEGTLYEVWPPPSTLLIVGSGPVAAPLSRMARTFGVRVVVTDDHAERLTPHFLPDAHDLLLSAPGQELQLPTLGPGDAVVVISHDYAHELSVLARVLDCPVGYIALVASRRRGKALLDFLRDTGTDPAALGRIRTPAGLDLGLPSPAGIALSILSEVVQVQSQGSGRRLSQH